MVTGERPIGSIRSITVEAGDPLGFVITVGVGGGEEAEAQGEAEDKGLRIPFQAESEREREEILAKFAAVLSLTGEARKIVRR